jgi:hypothetical protein
MADSVEMQDIRGLDIDKTVKGFGEVSYIFKNDCEVSSTSGDSIRWYQETNGDLTATAPSVVSNISPLSVFPTLEKTWTRQTTYVRKYAAEDFISMEDIKSADIDVIVRTLRALTRAVTKQVDARIWDVMTESRTVVNIQTFATTAVGGDQWDAANYAADIVKDLVYAKRLLYDQGYNPEGASLYVDSTGYASLVAWLISGKGSSIPNFSSSKIENGTVMQILGLNVKVSTNVTTDYAAVVIPKVACTWKEHTPITSRAIEEAGLGTKIRVWELGAAILTDPKAVVLITDINT